jgi:adenosylmethionine-8-amino-7-oxononanoate aminotransferase
MIMAKGLTSGYVPLAAVVVSEPIARFFEDRVLAGGLTVASRQVKVKGGRTTDLSFDLPATP